MAESRPRLLIVSPTWSQGWWGGGKVLAPPLSLPLLAGLTPPGVDVRLVDENVEPVDLEAPADWVAISCLTASAPRAYAVADAFRNRGIPVVLGGIHPTVLPEEAAAHADAVVVGEAEPVWPEVLADLAAGRLRPYYQSSAYADLAGLPLPRRELLRTERYLTINVVQTSRGCPNGCSFCTVSAIFGRSRRFRPIPEVIEEVRPLRGWIGFVDDNITCPPARAKELFAALIPLRRRWVGQGDLAMAKDPELLSLAARSGCQAMFVGLESLSRQSLRAAGKSPNLDVDMGEAIDRIHRAGIEIVGSFVFGLDGDDPGIFARTVAFAERHKLLAAQFAVLTPFPGTAVHEQLTRQGRVTDHDWSHYTMSTTVFEPRWMSALQLHQGQHQAYRRFYSLPSILTRSLTVRGKFLPRLLVNLSYRRIGRGEGILRGVPAQHRTKVMASQNDTPQSVFGKAPATLRKSEVEGRE
jgi:radical SAM superfamily enzyme YgiQ (UPF0313 family)